MREGLPAPNATYMPFYYSDAEKLFLFVTANENETRALLEDKDIFKYKVINSSNPDDVNFYNAGRFAEYSIIHFELPKQGSVKTDSSFSSIYDAINEYHPDAVLLIGIAFGKDYGTNKENEQKIGDVLISETVVDYESGKIKNGELASDGVIAESGRALLSVFKNKYKDWRHHLTSTRQAQCYFGQVLSGDKVVDDREFKELLFKRYPRAIGGEMEGRGTYSACKKKGLNEWIIIKGICDWGDGTKSKNKKKNQVCAARSTVSLLKYIFSDKTSFNVLQKHAYSFHKQFDTQEFIDEVELLCDFYERQKNAFLNSSAMPWLLGNSVSRDFIIPSLLISSKVQLVKHPLNTDFNFLLNKYKWETKSLILGAPGAGKSTLLFCYYLELIKKLNMQSLNIFIDAREFESYSDSFIDEVKLMEYFGDKLGAPQLASTKWAKYVILIDGLDEVSEALFFRIIELVNSSPKQFSFIVACREQTFYLRSAQNCKIERVFSESILINPWDIDSSKEYAKNYFSAIGFEMEFANFQKLISKDPNLRSFCSNPFQFNILIYIYLDEPQSLSDSTGWNTYSLYEKYINSLWKNEKIRNNKNLNFNKFNESCTNIAVSLYNSNENNVDVLLEKHTCVIQDSALLSILSTDQIERILKFRHESLFDFFVAKSFIDILRYGTTETLLYEFRNFYNYYINVFIRDGILVYCREADNFYKKLSTIYLACFRQEENLQYKMIGYLKGFNEQRIPSLSQLSYNLSENVIERELSIYYIGRLGLNSFPEILKFAFLFDPSNIIKRTAAIGAMLYREESIEFDYIDALLPNSSDDIIHRSLTLLYFEDAFGNIFDYKDNGHISWERSKQAIIRRLSQDSNRNLSFRLWDIRTINLFCQSRNSCKQLTDYDIEIISNSSITCSFYSKEKSLRMRREKDNLINYIKTWRF